MIGVDLQALQGLNMKLDQNRFLHCNLKDMEERAMRFLQLRLRTQGNLKPPLMEMTIFMKMGKSEKS